MGRLEVALPIVVFILRNKVNSEITAPFSSRGHFLFLFLVKYRHGVYPGSILFPTYFFVLVFSQKYRYYLYMANS